MEKEGFDVYIVVTTDEQPFINFLSEKFGEKLLYYQEALRSDTNTSGLKENFEKIVPRNEKIDTSNLSDEEQKNII